MTRSLKGDYCDYMTATLRQTKAKLSEMVKLASQGEEVIITVHGKEMAKLVGLPKRTKKLDKKKVVGAAGATAQEDCNRHCWDNGTGNPG